MNESSMNFYGSALHRELLAQYENTVFPHCGLSRPTGEKPLENGCLLLYASYSFHRLNARGYTEEVAGTVYGLYREETLLYSWKETDGHRHDAHIIRHTNGHDYLLFHEDIFGYSVLELDTLRSLHYLPEESYRFRDAHIPADHYPARADDQQETFIWVTPHYKPENNRLCVEGCFWGSPYTVILLDFSAPLSIVPACQWIDLSKRLPRYESLNFKSWQGNKLICEEDETKKPIIFDTSKLPL